MPFLGSQKKTWITATESKQKPQKLCLNPSSYTHPPQPPEMHAERGAQTHQTATNMPGASQRDFFTFKHTRA